MMIMERGWWYVVGLVVLVLFLVFVFKNDVGLGPKEIAKSVGEVKVLSEKNGRVAGIIFIGTKNSWDSESRSFLRGLGSFIK